MSGYVASARIVRAAPRLARADRVGETLDWAPAASTAEVLIEDGDDDTDRGSTLTDRREAFRARWAQLTFFLFDANSWRS